MTGGGIIYIGVDVVDVMLGSWQRHVHRNGTVPGSITVIQGGGGATI